MSDKKGEDPLASHVSGQSNRPMTSPAHALSPEKVVEDLGANAETGLTAEEAKKRLTEFGNNEFGDSGGVQPVKIFIGQLANALTLVRKIPSYAYMPVVVECGQLRHASVSKPVQLRSRRLTCSAAGL